MNNPAKGSGSAATADNVADITQQLLARIAAGDLTDDEWAQFEDLIAEIRAARADTVTCRHRDQAVLRRAANAPVVTLHADRKLMAAEVVNAGVAHGGVYVIERLVNDCWLPVYVGKSDTRKFDKKSNCVTLRDQAITGRANDHVKSLLNSSLPLDEFRIRLIRCVADEELAIEQTLVMLLQPRWNIWIVGFGKHSPGKNRDEEHSASEKDDRVPWDALYERRDCGHEMSDEERAQRLADEEAALHDWMHDHIDWMRLTCRQKTWRPPRPRTEHPGEQQSLFALAMAA